MSRSLLCQGVPEPPGAGATLRGGTSVAGMDGGPQLRFAWETPKSAVPLESRWVSGAGDNAGLRRWVSRSKLCLPPGLLAPWGHVPLLSPPDPSASFSRV